MRPVSHRRPGGFTLIEALIALAIIGITLAFGLPQIFSWVRATKIQTATEFYAEGFRYAHDEAVKHKAASRIVLTANTTNGQLDWQVDLCFPTPTVTCDDQNGTWSTVTTSAVDPNNPTNTTDFKSVFRSSGHLLSTTTLRPTITPLGSNETYYTSLGWTNTAVPDNVRMLTLDAPPGSVTFPSVAIAVTLAGAASKCNPNAVAHDSRGCPPP